MHEIAVHLEMKLADAMGELRIWLDHNDYVPVSLLVRMIFAEEGAAEEFKRTFAR